MSIAIGTGLSPLFSYGRGSSTPAGSSPSLANILAGASATSSQASSSTTVTPSDAAKAYLARNVTKSAASAPTAAELATSARTWFDQQYKSLGISSAMLDGKVAVDLTGQSRATLSAVASNGQGMFSKDQGMFSKDESAAATEALQSRFDAAVSPSVVIARHNGDYASLYEAALKYMNEAGTDEQATTAWQDQKQALVDGAAAAKKAFGKAPDTGDANDPVQALLSKATSSGSITATADIASVAANARALLDDQENSAKDKGTELVFDRSRTNGQQVDFSKFDNRSLAAVALNQGSSFSNDESRAAKTELDQRYRTSILNALSPTTSSSASTNGNFPLLQQYAGMSDEERSALGVTASFTNSLVQSYRTQLSVQNVLGGNSSLGLAAYI
jgi:hypothetical protein